MQKTAATLLQCGGVPNLVTSSLIFAFIRRDTESVQPRPDARKIQYRLYYEIHYRVFTDGILHQLQLGPSEFL